MVALSSGLTSAGSMMSPLDKHILNCAAGDDIRRKCYFHLQCLEEDGPPSSLQAAEGTLDYGPCLGVVVVEPPGCFQADWLFVWGDDGHRR